MTAPRCVHRPGLTCDRLLDDPLATLADPKKWPTHLCPEVAYASNVQWAEERAQRLYGHDVPAEVADWITMYPLPVGRWSLPAGVPEVLAVLPGYGKAAVMPAPAIPYVEAIAFGIVDDHPLVSIELDGEARFVPVSMQFAISGWADWADTFRDRAARWWDLMAGETITGRPQGRKYTRADVVDAYREFRATNGWRPTQTEIAVELSVSAKSVRTYTGQNWEDFVRDIEAMKAR